MSSTCSFERNTNDFPDKQIEREKTDLTVQLMSLSDRLDEAEGGAEHVVESNKKRDAELSKLRKLLEDVHLESEETCHHLRQKHQAAVAELQDQCDQLQKAKNRCESCQVSLSSFHSHNVFLCYYFFQQV